MYLVNSLEHLAWRVSFNESLFRNNLSALIKVYMASAWATPLINYDPVELCTISFNLLQPHSLTTFTVRNDLSILRSCSLSHKAARSFNVFFFGHTSYWFSCGLGQTWRQLYINRRKCLWNLWQSFQIWMWLIHIYCNTCIISYGMEMTVFSYLYYRSDLDLCKKKSQRKNIFRNL